MTAETRAAALAIPPAAADAWFVCGCREDCGRAGYQHEALPVIVAAELRKLAEEIANRSDSDNTWWFMDVLTDRADELDPQ